MPARFDSARRVVALSTSLGRCAVDVRRNGGAWRTIGIAENGHVEWTPDIAGGSYEFRAVPVDAAGTAIGWPAYATAAVPAAEAALTHVTVGAGAPLADGRPDDLHIDTGGKKIWHRRLPASDLPDGETEGRQQATSTVQAANTQPTFTLSGIAIPASMVAGAAPSATTATLAVTKAGQTVPGYALLTLAAGALAAPDRTSLALVAVGRPPDPGVILPFGDVESTASALTAVEDVQHLGVAGTYSWTDVSLAAWVTQALALTAPEWKVTIVQYPDSTRSEWSAAASFAGGTNHIYEPVAANGWPPATRGALGDVWVETEGTGRVWVRGRDLIDVGGLDSGPDGIISGDTDIEFLKSRTLGLPAGSPAGKGVYWGESSDFENSFPAPLELFAPGSGDHAALKNTTSRLADGWTYVDFAVGSDAALPVVNLTAAARGYLNVLMRAPNGTYGRIRIADLGDATDAYGGPIAHAGRRAALVAWLAAAPLGHGYRGWLVDERRRDPADLSNPWYLVDSDPVVDNSYPDWPVVWSPTDQPVWIDRPSSGTNTKTVRMGFYRGKWTAGLCEAIASIDSTGRQSWAVRWRWPSSMTVRLLRSTTSPLVSRLHITYGGVSELVSIMDNSEWTVYSS